jgi:hypothetical protein
LFTAPRRALSFVALEGNRLVVGDRDLDRRNPLEHLTERIFGRRRLELRRSIQMF